MGDRYIPINFNGVLNERDLPSKTYALDFEGKSIAGHADARSAVEQAIKKTLLTQRLRHHIYDAQYGSDLRKIIFADGITPEFIEAEFRRLIEDALLADERISGISEFEYKIDGDCIYVDMRVDTVFGDIKAKMMM